MGPAEDPNNRSQGGVSWRLEATQGWRETHDRGSSHHPAMSLKEAIQAFTEAAYGERLTFESA